MDMKVSTLLKRTEVVGGYDPENYHSERLYAEATDGKKYLFRLSIRKDIRKTVKATCYCMPMDPMAAQTIHHSVQPG